MTEPTTPTFDHTATHVQRGAGRVAFGALLVALGIVLLLDQAGLLAGSWRSTVWPVLLAGYGVARLLMPTRHGREGLFFVLAGAWWFAGLQDWLSLVRTWPLLFVALGASVVLQAVTTPRRGSPEAEALRGRRDGAASWVLVAILIGTWVTTDLRDWSHAAVMPDGRPRLVTVASRGHASALSQPFGGAQLVSVMGRGELDLRDATGVTGSEVVVDVVTLMGSTTVIVPPGWSVETRPVLLFGAVRRRERPGDRLGHEMQPGRAIPDAPATAADASGVWSDVPAASGPAAGRPRLVLRGAVIMGSLTIVS